MVHNSLIVLVVLNILFSFISSVAIVKAEKASERGARLVLFLGGIYFTYIEILAIGLIK